MTVAAELTDGLVNPFSSFLPVSLCNVPTPESDQRLPLSNSPRLYYLPGSCKELSVFFNKEKPVLLQREVVSLYLMSAASLLFF